MKYLVSVEQPYGENEEMIVVTDDVESFGPDLLAAYPILTIEADTPEVAGYRYARKQRLTHVLIQVNLLNIYDEWWMEKSQAHKIDPDGEAIWEPL